MGLFGGNDAATKALKEKGYSVNCYGETENTGNMSQFALFYRVSASPKKVADGGLVAVATAAINDDLFSKGLVPASIKILDTSTSLSLVEAQVIAKRIS